MPAVLAAFAAAASLAVTPPALHLKPCLLGGAVSARCGTLAVPEDRRVANGRRISVFFAVVPATTRKRLEPVFYLAGGPGGAAASDQGVFAASVFASGDRARDLVLVDQRGVGRSAPLVCAAPPFTSDVSVLLAYARTCLESVGRDPRLYTTDNAMDDVDAVRQALGYPKIVLYGGSYGATAAQVYIARHGSHVRAAVLDGATLLDVPFWDRLPANAQSAMDALAARCAADARCHAAFPDVAGDLAVALERLRAEPLAVDAGGTQVAFGSVEAAGVIEGMQLTPQGIARLPLALHEAAAGRYDRLESAFTAAVERVPVKLMYYAIRCGEGWAGGADPAAVAAANAGSYYLDTTLADLEGMAGVCPLFGTPLPAPDTGTVPQSTVPVLFLVGGMDPQDPLGNLAGAGEHLLRSQTLVVPGAGHGSVQYGCLPSVATHWFASLRLTAADRRCAAAVKLPPFVLP